MSRDILRSLGFTSSDQLAWHEDLSDLENDIRSVPGLENRLQDDVFASRVNGYLQNRTLLKLAQTRFFNPSWGEIGRMIADLRKLGEHPMYFHNGGLRGVNHRADASDLDVFLESAGWRILSDDEELSLDEARKAAGL